tara:strand:- start:223 stop:1107 length:885 start_codon:yes stop_codon:yes gene_type:complete
MENRWVELTVLTPVELSELVSAYLLGISPQGVAVEEPVTRDQSEDGYRLDMSQPQALRVWLPIAEKSAVLIENLREKFVDLPIEITVRPIKDEDWQIYWREFFGPIVVGRIAVIPSWVDFKNEEKKTVIRIDPGQAFGTGHHETTRLCLNALSKYVSEGQSVLDVGTGSGILSIAAAYLGAGSVDGWDIDPSAVKIAQSNCVVNNVAEKITVHEGEFKSAGQQYDLIVSNISAVAVEKLVPLFASGASKPDARLVLSGFLKEDVQRIENVASSTGFIHFESYLENDWALISAMR